LAHAFKIVPSRLPPCFRQLLQFVIPWFLFISDKTFHLQVMKEMLIQTFGVPAGHRAAKPFHDHIISFFYLDGRVWLRHYQVTVIPFPLLHNFQVSLYLL
jgi:hypothetical protein